MSLAKFVTKFLPKLPLRSFCKIDFSQKSFHNPQLFMLSTVADLNATAIVPNENGWIPVSGKPVNKAPGVKITPWQTRKPRNQHLRTTRVAKRHRMLAALSKNIQHQPQTKSTWEIWAKGATQVSSLGNVIMKFGTLASTVLLILGTACTPRPDSIAPVSMTGAYDHLSCSSARKQLADERTRLVALEKQQNAAATGDAIGVFLILVPVSKLTGGDVAGEVGTSKGKVLALEQRVSSC